MIIKKYCRQCEMGKEEILKLNRENKWKRKKWILLHENWKKKLLHTLKKQRNLILENIRFIYIYWIVSPNHFTPHILVVHGSSEAMMLSFHLLKLYHFMQHMYNKVRSIQFSKTIKQDGELTCSVYGKYFPSNVTTTRSFPSTPLTLSTEQ